MARTISVPAASPAPTRGSKRLLALRGDDHLVERLRRGDETAFEVVYERHVPGILSFCRHMLGSREEAEDAVQHTFAAAHRDLVRDDREIRLKAWLYAIARNRCLSMLRARREQPGERLDGSTEGLDDEVQRRADLRELVADLQDLPEDQRAALVLSELRDLSHADVAEALGCQVANVKGLVFRARSGLIERREARGAACDEIQAELATARGGALRRGRLRHHLRACTACSSYLDQVRAQRKMMAVILPVLPTLGLKKGVLAAVGIGGGASGGGGAAAGGGLLAAVIPTSGATVAKIAVVGALVGGAGVAGVAGEAAVDGEGPPTGSPPPVVPERSTNAPPSPFGGTDDAQASERLSAGERRARGRKARKARRRGRARGRARRQATPAARAPRRLGQAKPKKVRGFERPVTRPPHPTRPVEPPRLRPQLPDRVRPIPEPKERVVAKPAPADRSGRKKPTP